LAFGVAIDKDVVRRILSVHLPAVIGSGGPSWLAFLGHMKDSPSSMDLFRCESASLRTYWVLVVMDQYSRRIIGFSRPGARLVRVEALGNEDYTHDHRLKRYLLSI